MDIQVLYEDDDILVIDKPSGVVVNRALTVRGETLQDWMADRYHKIWSKLIIKDQKVSGTDLPACKYRGTSDVITSEDQRYFVERLGMVHRLDKETSGVMIFAKTTNAFVSLLAQFREHTIVKEYIALTHGLWKVKSGEINLPIGRRSDDRKKMGIVESGRESVTHYQVLTEYESFVFPKELRVDTRGYQGFSLVHFRLETGRTHQIRVHAKAVGHPLVSDFQYGGRKRSREDRKWLPHVALLAKKLVVSHPSKNVRMEWESMIELFSQPSEYLSKDLG